MRIHSSTLTRGDLFGAVNPIPDVWVHEWTEHGSRSRERALEVKLRGGGMRHTRWPNPGASGGIDYGGGKAATYDDWGRFLATLYDTDPRMIIAGVYADRADFHERTRYAFWTLEAATA